MGKNDRQCGRLHQLHFAAIFSARSLNMEILNNTQRPRYTRNEKANQGEYRDR
jgi:hypothetical protein